MFTTENTQLHVKWCTCSLIVKNYNIEIQGVRSRIAFYIVTMFHYLDDYMLFL